MFRVTKFGEYGIRGILHLAEANGDKDKPSLLKDIAKAEDIPEKFLAKIFQNLARSGIVTSKRGSRGGFVLGKPIDEVTMLEVLEVLEGPIYLNVCLIRKGYCPRDESCTVHPVWVEAQEALKGVLTKYTLKDLLHERKSCAAGNGDRKSTEHRKAVK